MSGGQIGEADAAEMTPKERDCLFPLTRSKPIAPDSYEFALVLAGTVSAGAYTAGVLDFVLEALDAWEIAKTSNDPITIAAAPTHKAILSTITGASGGGINAAIFTRVAGFAFPHGAIDENPFYDVWVNQISIDSLLAPDQKPKGFRALFNTSVFDTVANSFVQKTGPALGTGGSPMARKFFADPLRLIATLANVTGIPYRISFRGESNLGHDLVAHTDFVRFALTVPEGVGRAPRTRPDEFALCANNSENWNYLSDMALATSAFPAAFPSRPITRRSNAVGYRVAVVPGEDQNNAEVAQLIPLWKELAPGITSGMLRTVNVDGGTLNNEPLDYARLELAGYNGRNPRDGALANRGVVLVDPFSDPEQISLFDPPDFFGLLNPLVSTLVQQARFKPEDLALATDYDTFSRFLVAPVGPGGGLTAVPGSKAIAAGGLGGFLGFIDRRLLDYDFKLGRYNAYKFLKEEFVLPENNAIFNSRTWTDDQRQAYRIPETKPGPGRPQYYLPIIPLMPALEQHAPKPPTHTDWPRQKSFPADFGDKIRARLDSVFAAITADMQDKGTWPGGLLGFAINQTYKLWLRGFLRDKAVGAFQQALNDQNLLPTFIQKFPLGNAGQVAAQTCRGEWLAAGATSSTLSADKNNWILTTLWP